MPRYRVTRVHEVEADSVMDALANGVRVDHSKVIELSVEKIDWRDKVELSKEERGQADGDFVRDFVKETDRLDPPPKLGDTVIWRLAPNVPGIVTSPEDAIFKDQPPPPESPAILDRDGWHLVVFPATGRVSWLHRDQLQVVEEEMGT